MLQFLRFDFRGPQFPSIFRTLRPIITEGRGKYSLPRVQYAFQIVAASASPISVLAASESSSDVVVPATLPSQPDPVFSAPLSSPAQVHCDVDPVSTLMHFCSTPSPVPSLSPAPTLDATTSPALQESVFAETVKRLSAAAQQKGLAFDVSTLSQFVQDASVRIQLTFFLLFFFSNRSFQSHYSANGFT